MVERRLVGRPAAQGFACGPLAVLAGGAKAAERAAGTSQEERGRLSAAIAEALRQLEALLGAAEGDGADILAFQVAMLEDAELAGPAFAALDEGGAAEAAWSAALGREIADYESSEDAHFRARASDIADIRDRVLAALTGAGPEGAIAPGSVVLARDLSPSRFLSTDWSRGGAIALTAGSAHGHVATLARARGVPMIVGLGVEPETAPAGAVALLDGAEATLWLDPAPATRAAFEARAARAGADAASAAAFLAKPARTKDGVAVAVLINVASPAELDALDPALCDGVGLVRTEFLFEGRREPPDEDAQYETYARIVNWAAGRPVTIRTLDAGGDKPIPGLTLDGEANPFLGLRGIRLSLARPDVLRAQLRALCRVAALGPVEVMLPMVALAEEVARAAALLDEEFAALRAVGRAARRPALGIMVETPAAAIAPDLIDADFYSIGSNDLTQYVLAAARDSEAVAALYDPAHPAVLRLIAGVAAHGAARGRKVSLCGDAGGDPRLVGRLLAAGLRALSVAPSAVAAVKQAIAAVDLGRGAMTDEAPLRDARSSHVEAYKTLLRNVLDRRPSGTRQRLAHALGKNRSFVSQISNPAYPAPIPAPHIETIFEMCHFSPAERREFLEAFNRAHPNRLKPRRGSHGVRTLKLEVADFGDAAVNREFDELVRETARRLSRLLRAEEG